MSCNNTLDIVVMGKICGRPLVNFISDASPIGQYVHLCPGVSSCLFDVIITRLTAYLYEVRLSDQLKDDFIQHAIFTAGVVKVPVIMIIEAIKI